MVPVVVQRTAIVYDRRDPDCGKTQVLNVIQLLDEPLEIAPPGGGGGGGGWGGVGGGLHPEDRLWRD